MSAANNSQSVPVCPKCGKVISPKKYRRHLARCGSHHKQAARPLDSNTNIFMKM
jgi:uncharacterized C2H2 Zn-finger protein